MKSALKEHKKSMDKPEKGDDLDELLEGVEVEEVVEDEPKEKKSEKDDMGGDMGGDPVKVFVDVLDLDDMTAQAVYAEAMSLPELAEMSPEQMAKKIKGNYDMLKKILTSMGEKAAMAMQDELNKPMDMPGGDMGPPPGGDMGGAPGGGPPGLPPGLA